MRTWIRDHFPHNLWVTFQRHWPWAIIGGMGLMVHAATALLRLSTFFPYPRLLDFSGFYASAWAIRQGLSPYNLPPDWLQTLQIKQAIPLTPPPIFNPPFWPWLLQPLTWFHFPAAVSIWLLLNVALLAWAAVAIAQIAGYHDWRMRVVIFLLVLTFGPVFLDLTLGQTSVVLLVTALAIGRSLSSRRGSAPVWTAVAGGLAAGAKLFPLTWLGPLAFLRRWRELVLTTLVVVIIFGLAYLAVPTGSREYGKYFLEQRLATSSEVTSVDDQALIAWLDRLVRPQSFDVSGLGIEERKTVVWSPPWNVEAKAIRRIGYILLALLLLPCLFLLLRTTTQQQEAVFYLWVLYGLVALLHIERYNHVLLLPAMAWLLSRGQWQRKAVILAYALTGLSRLTHLWAMLLPAPWGPLASGFGLYAVFLLGVAIVVSLRPSILERA